MSKEHILDISIIIVIVLLFLSVHTPFHIIMPSMETAIVLCVTLFLLLVFGVFFWKSQSRDEREFLHRAQAGEVSYLIGALILTIGMIVELLSHSVNTWLALALSSMVIAKIMVRMYLTHKK